MTTGMISSDLLWEWIECPLENFDLCDNCINYIFSFWHEKEAWRLFRALSPRRQNMTMSKSKNYEGWFLGFRIWIFCSNGNAYFDSILVMWLHFSQYIWNHVTKVSFEVFSVDWKHFMIHRLSTSESGRSMTSKSGWSPKVLARIRPIFPPCPISPWLEIHSFRSMPRL